MNQCEYAKGFEATDSMIIYLFIDFNLSFQCAPTNLKRILALQH